MFKNQMVHYKKQLGKDLYEQLEVGYFHTDTQGKSVSPINSDLKNKCFRLTIWNSKHEVVKILTHIDAVKTMRNAMVKIIESQ
jgi:hypothetical protein